MLNTLKVTTPNDHDIVIARVFNAPGRMVWDAMTMPELVKRWLTGPPGWEMTQCEGEAVEGERFRWAWRGPDGMEMAMSGVYREVTPPTRLVRTETFEFGCAPQAGEQIGTLDLSEKDGKTTLTLTVKYPSKEARDGAVASGMEQGLAAGYAALDKVLAGE
ncbi:MAG: SRPBCC family protein [Phycisphaerales bacterium]|nr:SRPBCC family protein [Phycisphaerales bacterium]